ncbi:uncharacterized protein LOC133307075 [Gastrolobium bilobum]|uniref:uncharacterized protein LOC133307075 n=1 Tax=Gastrolobium bilobum TaxID=150636 RepID=UPI002AB05747|nr:uncharacterized protein LOC133307075 [Gastrolobium bilobum]
MIGKQNTVITIARDHKESRDCYFKSVRAVESDPEPSAEVKNSSKQDGSSQEKKTSVNMVELDMRDDTQMPRPEPDGELEEVIIGEQGQTAKIGKVVKGLTDKVKVQLIACLRNIKDVFAWKSSEIPGFNPAFCCHKLAVYPGSRPVAQKKRKLSPECWQVLEDHVKELLEAGFIREIQYTTWLSNVVMVKKLNGKYRVCTDYIDLNKVCPKDAYPMPNVDQLVDSSSKFQMLSFMDAYSGYNQIPLHPEDQEKTAFIAEKANYCYNVMPFGLKNSGAIYQRMMNQVFAGQLGKSVEVYIDDMIVKSLDSKVHIEDLEATFEKLRQRNIRLNPAKCAFGVPAVKFLGFMLTHRGIEANPDKCRAVLEMKSPTNKKEIQQLMGRLGSLTGFLPRSAETTLPFFKLLRKEVQYGWTLECEAAFQEIKRQLASPPVLTRPREGEALIIYLYVGDVAVNSVIVQENEEGKQPIYFVSWLLQGAELRYEKLEKVAFALLTSTRRLRAYFQAHQIIVRSDLPIRQVLHKPDLAGRMMAWAVELSEFDIVFKSRKAIKSQTLVDFIRELTSIQRESSHSSDTWKVYVDGSSNSKGSGAGVIIENPEGVAIEYSLQMNFETSNNQAEYEAFIVGLHQAKELGARKLQVYRDSQFVTSQIEGSYQARGPLLTKYLDSARQLIVEFEKVEVSHIPRNENSRADILSKLASTKGWENHRTVVEQSIPEPTCIMQISEVDDWRCIIVNYLENRTLPAGKEEARKLVKDGASYTMVEGQLYKKGIYSPLLKCLSLDRARHFLSKIHEGINGQHIGGKALARKQLEPGVVANLYIRYRFASVEHPQINGQAEAANQVIIEGLRKRIEQSVKGKWVEELCYVLWGYRTTVQTSTGESPFKLTYGCEAMIPVELGEPSWRIVQALSQTEEESSKKVAVELDLIDEARVMAHCKNFVAKQLVANWFNKKVKPRSFTVGDLVLRRADVGGRNTTEGKLAPKWEGPFRIKERLSKGAYVLETPKGKSIIRTWNADKVKKYFS